MGLNVKMQINGLDKLKEHIEFVKKMAFLKTDKKFQEYMKSKFLETVNQISMQLLPEGELKSKYISNNRIKNVDNGFVLFNNTTIATDTEGYGGNFSIALAFEYGTGIVGQNNPKIGAWQYNVKGHLDGWWYPTNDSDRNPVKFTTSDGLTLAWTKGFEGFEVYRVTLEEIKSKISQWIKEYKLGGASK